MLRTLGSGQSTERNIQSRPNLGLGGVGGNETGKNKNRPGHGRNFVTNM
jgi:hypothetical protein